MFDMSSASLLHNAPNSREKSAAVEGGMCDIVGL